MICLINLKLIWIECWAYKGDNSMCNYYLNEYSLRGQFENTDAFFESVRRITFDVLKKIGCEKTCVIFKKEIFYDLEVCPDMTLHQALYEKKKNERDDNKVAFKQYMLKVVKSPPYLSGDAIESIEVVEYKFDEEHRENFDEINCFTETILNEKPENRRVISFEHEEYKATKLSVDIKCEGENDITECHINNIWNLSYWKREREIKKFPKIRGKYKIEVRANDHEPKHFHVSYEEEKRWSRFHIGNGEIIRGRNDNETKQLNFKEQQMVKSWYEKHKEELCEAWDILNN